MPKAITPSKARFKQCESAAAQIGVDADMLYASASAMWSNMNPQLYTFNQALSLAMSSATAVKRNAEKQTPVGYVVLTGQGYPLRTDDGMTIALFPSKNDAAEWIVANPKAQRPHIVEVKVQS